MRLVQEGDMVLYTPKGEGKTKNLTIGREYFVEAFYQHESDGVPYVNSVTILNDKGVSYSYSVRNFTPALDEVIFDMEGHFKSEQQVLAAHAEVFMSELKDL
jgi:hypothetical protein